MVQSIPLTSRVGLPHEAREALATDLNGLLADLIDLKLRTKQAHWNVRGLQFIAVHEMLDEIAAHVEDHSDEVAERIGQLGGYASGTVQEAASRTTLTPYPTESTGVEALLRPLASSLGAVADRARTAIGSAADRGDDVTADILTQIARSLDKDAWFVESHLG